MILEVALPDFERCECPSTLYIRCMTCPRCQTASLQEIDRDGISIDRCERCRGLWLDRGELEKLQARDLDDRRGSRDRDDDDDDDDDRRGRRRGSFWDIFD